MSDDGSEFRSGWLKKITSMLSYSDQPQHFHQTFLSLIEQAQRNNVLNDDTARMMRSLLELSNTQVRDIMVPRGQMIVIEDEWSFDKVLSIIIESGHSRYPVVTNEYKSVLGILITKDLLPILADRIAEKSFLEVMRPATLVPEGKPLDAMLREFRTNRNHMAVVIDEYGNLSGLVTIEDVIEEIVGEIDDEHDDIPDAEVRILAENLFHVDALMTIEDFNERFSVTFSDKEADTIGGYVLYHFGRMPESGEEIDIENWHFTIAKANQRRILSLYVSAIN